MTDPTQPEFAESFLSGVWSLSLPAATQAVARHARKTSSVWI